MDVSNSQLASDQPQPALQTPSGGTAALGQLHAAPNEAEEVRSANISQMKDEKGRVQSAYRVKSYNSGPHAADTQTIGGYSRTQVKTNSKTDDGTQVQAR